MIHFNVRIQFQEYIMNVILHEPELFTLIARDRLKSTSNLMVFLPVPQTGVLSSQFGKVCMQFQEKKQPYTYLAIYAWCNLHWLQSCRGLYTIPALYLQCLQKHVFCVSTHCGSVHGSSKNQLYTYFACRSRPSDVFMYCAMYDLMLRKKFNFRNL